MSSVDRSSTVGFVGMGVMGGGMAANLARSGLSPLVFDANPSAVERVVAAGARAAPTVAEVATHSEHLFLCLPFAPEVRAVLFDEDGIAYRTYPGTHPGKGAFFTRGTSKTRYARYSEEGPDYVENMQRLLRKFETARSLVPEPVRTDAEEPATIGVIYYGSTTPAMNEAVGMIAEEGHPLNLLRIRAFPFPESVADFIADHTFIFVVEQNRDGQLRTLLINELSIDPARLVPVLHYDGTPITARFIAREISEHLAALKVTPLRRAAS